MGLLSLDGVAVDAEEFVIAYLTPLFVNVGAEMEIDPPYPFFEVIRITGAEDMVSDHPVVQINVFHTDYTLAKNAAKAMHAAMKALTPKTSVVVEGLAYGVDYRCVEETPRWVDYDDKTVRRFVARYSLGLRLL